MAALSSAGMATIGAAGAPDQLSIATVLGAAGLAAIAGSSAQVATGDGGQPLVVVQMMKVIAALQAKLHESEEGIHELQAQADQLEEKRRSWSNRLERSERERSKALQQRDQLEAAADEARKEARPLMERHMELEVVKCQVPLLLEDQDRLREEKECHFQELERGWPRLTDAEDAEAQCIEAIAELELAHAEELAHVRSAFTEEGADLRARHATRMAEIEGARQADLAQIRAAHAEELLLLRSAFEDSEWQAEVYVREQQEAVREACIRQRENARIAKRCSEARAEALELAVKLEALRAAGRGAPAREAELEAVRQRCSLLQRTAAEWRESLEKKNRDCERWRRRAAQKGVVSEVDEEEVDIRLASPASASFMSTSAAPTPQPGAGTAPLVAIAAASSSAGGAADVARQSHRAPPALQDVSHGGDASVLSLPAEPLTPVQAASPSADSFMSHDRSVTGLHLPPPNESSWSNVPSPTRTPSLPSRRPLAGAGAGAGRSRGVAPPGARQNRLAVPGAGPQVQLTRRSHPQLPTQQLQVEVDVRSAAWSEAERRHLALSAARTAVVSAPAPAPPLPLLGPPLGANGNAGVHPARGPAGGISRIADTSTSAAFSVVADANAADEFVAVALRAAELQAEVAAAAARVPSPAPTPAQSQAAASASSPPGDGEEDRVLESSGNVSPANDATAPGSPANAGAGAALGTQQSAAEADDERLPRLTAAAREAEQELEMLTFLLGDADAAEVASLLEREAKHQPPAVARRLLAQHAELAARTQAQQQRRLSPDSGRERTFV
eukprot:TRINITY_DN9947_c0_g2_i1.p1 TRINITY_DN9947_c0_g2~~TRINITY_DN9947_c0_g2_i1.p1  ORF type:complete len:790 (+),score=221.63 TRINITY_DN9947_c0_g2_i1:61-2430(+)